MAFINSDGSAAVKDVGELAVENDGSPQGVQAVSLKEPLGRRANRLGAAARADSTGALIALNNSGVTQLAQLPLAGAGMRHHVVLISLMLLGGTVGTDWGFFSISWNMDDGQHTHIHYMGTNTSQALALDGQICTASNDRVTISAQAGTGAALKAMASIQSLVLPDA